MKRRDEVMIEIMILNSSVVTTMHGQWACGMRLSVLSFYKPRRKEPREKSTGRIRIRKSINRETRDTRRNDTGTILIVRVVPLIRGMNWCNLHQEPLFRNLQ